MRAAFQFALSFAKSEKRGGIQQIIQHQAVGYALADAKTTIEAARVLSWHACRALDNGLRQAHSSSLSTPRCSDSEAAVRVITNLMQVVGVDSYGHEMPLRRFASGRYGVAAFRRRQISAFAAGQLHALMLDPAYDDLATLDAYAWPKPSPNVKRARRRNSLGGGPAIRLECA